MEEFADAAGRTETDEHVRIGSKNGGVCETFEAQQEDAPPSSECRLSDLARQWPATC